MIGGSLTHLWHGIENGEDTPPLYYVLAWLWTHVFGTSEAGLRSLSALAGVGAVAAVYAAGRSLAGHRVGLVAAALAATSPYLVWYSQEARSYALLVLLTVVGLALCARALRRPETSTFVWWSVVSVLAVWTHYFAVFAFAGQALVLLAWSSRRRLAAVAAAAVVLGALPLLPLEQHQAGRHHVLWLADLSMLYRIRQTATLFALGPGFHGGIPRSAIAVCVLCALVVAGGCVLALVLLARRAGRRELSTAKIAGAVAAAVIVLPLALSLAGRDYVFHRNLIPALPALALVAAAGLGARRAGRIGLAAAAAVAAAGVAVVATTDATPAMQRDNFRGVSHALGPAMQDRILVIGPRWGIRPLVPYQHHLVDLPAAGRAVREVDFLSADGRIPPNPLPPAFRLVSTRRVAPLTVLRFRAPRPVLVRRAPLGTRSFDPSGLPIVMFQPRGS